METGILIGLVSGLSFTIISIFLAGDNQISAVTSFIDAPSFLITIGGSVATAIGSLPLQKFIGGFKNLSKVFKPTDYDPVAAIKDIISLADSARKEGLLSLDEKSADMDPFIRKGIMLVVDGTDSEVVRNVLETELIFIEDRHKSNIQVWEILAEQFPAWGMIGTLVGLVIMLQNLDDPSAIGPKMAVALITTFYGSLFNNYLAVPFSNKMKEYSKQELKVKELCIEGILSVASGENPRMIEEKLKVFISPALRSSFEEGDS